MPSSVVAPVPRNRFERGLQTTSIVTAIAKLRPKSQKNFQYVTQTPGEKYNSSQEIYCKKNRTQQVTHCRVGLTKDEPMKTCHDTVHSNKLARKKEPNNKQIISSGLR